MSFKKYNDSTWQPITPKQLKGIPYTGTLPATITGTKAGYLHRYKIYGNTVQDGTPTPDNPIVPSECGERTENLFDKDATDTNNGYIDNRAITSSGSTASNTNFYISEYIRVSPNTNYSWKWTTSISSSTTISMALYDANKELVRAISYGINVVVNFLTSSNEIYARVTVQKGSKAISMLTAGSTAPTSYIPYGYKLPLTSAGQDVDIYLGESQTTRRIKKLVLTGKENWLISSSWKGTTTSVFYFNDYTIYTGEYNVRIVYSDRFLASTRDELYNGDSDMSARTGTNSITFRVSDSIATTLTGWTQYLAQQYANGTPVTIWYVLATPTTGTLNEPLRKIGDYADTIDSTQTSAQIPTSANSTTISWAGEGLAPSEFDSIQEWVDIPTYKRINGEWVADN